VLAAAGALVLADRGLLSPPAEDVPRYDGKSFLVARVIDGDTLELAVADDKTGQRVTKVRLWGVDTPETVKPNSQVDYFGPEASAFSKSRAQGQWVTVRLDRRDTRDKYNRLLAYVLLPDGAMLNRELIAEGYGYADPRFPHDLSSEFAALQKQARREGRGLWANVRPEQLPAYMNH
jgi:micrococcal nuclease